LKAINKNINIIKYLNFNLKNKKRIYEKVINHFEYPFYIHQENFINYDYLKKTIFHLTYNSYFKYLNLKDKNIILYLIKKYKFFYILIEDEKLKFDYDIALEILSKHDISFNLFFKDTIIMNDKTFLIELIKRNGIYIKYLNNTLKNDKEIIAPSFKSECFEVINSKSSTLRENCNSFELMGDELKNDKEFILKEGLKVNAFNIKFVNNRLKSDKDIVIEALNHNSLSLEYANDDMKSNKEIALYAIKKNVNSFHLINNNCVVINK
jgi:hypothetical protein